MRILFELRIVKRSVEAALLLEKRIVVALLDYLTVLDYNDDIGILNCGKTMRDNEAGLVLHQLAHRALDLYLGAGVDV